MCFASQPSSLFSFPSFCHFLLPGLHTVQNFHSIRVDCFTFARAQLSQRARHDSSRPTLLTHRIASRLPIPPAARFRPAHSISITIDRAGTGCACTRLHWRQGCFRARRETNGVTGTDPSSLENRKAATKHRRITWKLSQIYRAAIRLHRVIIPPPPIEPPSKGHFKPPPVPIYLSPCSAQFTTLLARGCSALSISDTLLQSIPGPDSNSAL